MLSVRDLLHFFLKNPFFFNMLLTKGGLFYYNKNSERTKEKTMRNKLGFLFLVISLTITLSSSAFARLQVGQNLTYIADWNTIVIFKDAFRKSRAWLTQTVDTNGSADISNWEYDRSWTIGDATVALDEYLYPLEIPYKSNDGNSYYVSTVMYNLDAKYNPDGEYLLTFKGKGIISLHTDDWYFFTNETGETKAWPVSIYDETHYRLGIDYSEAEDPVHDIQLIEPGYWDINDIEGTNMNNPLTAFDSSPFITNLISDLQGINPIRVWGDFEGSPFYNVDYRHTTNWNQRIRKHGKQGGRGELGIAYEWILMLADELDTDIWFNISPYAGEEYYSNMAWFLKTNEDSSPDTKFYLEYGNENWNTMMPWYGYCYDTAIEHFSDQGASPGENWIYELASVKAMDIHRVFTSIFGGTNRLYTMYSGQAGSENSLRTFIEMFRTESEVKDGIYGGPDMIGQENYDYQGTYGVQYVVGLNRAQYFHTYEKPDDAIYGELDHWSVDDVHDYALRDIYEDIMLHTHFLTEFARTNYDMETYFYEGGSHINTYTYTSDKRYTDFLLEVNKAQRMYDTYFEYMNMLNTNGLTVWNHFDYMRKDGSLGQWGSKWYIGQPAEEAPKWRALNDWVNENPRPGKVPRIRKVEYHPGNEVEIHWEQMSNAEQNEHTYEVYISLEKNPYEHKTPDASFSSTKTNFRTNVMPNTPTYIWVKSVNNVGRSGHSDIQRVVAADTVPPAPTMLSAETDYDYKHEEWNQIGIEWTYVETADYYHIYRNTVESMNTATKVFEAWRIETNYIDTVPEGDTTYYYWAIATNMQGESAVPVPVSVKSKPFPGEVTIEYNPAPLLYTWYLPGEFSNIEFWIGAKSITNLEMYIDYDPLGSGDLQLVDSCPTPSNGYYLMSHTYDESLLSTGHLGEYSDFENPLSAYFVGYSENGVITNQYKNGKEYFGVFEYTSNTHPMIGGIPLVAPGYTNYFVDGWINQGQGAVKWHTIADYDPPDPFGGAMEKIADGVYDIYGYGWEISSHWFGSSISENTVYRYAPDSMRFIARVSQIEDQTNRLGQPPNSAFSNDYPLYYDNVEYGWSKVHAGIFIAAPHDDYADSTPDDLNYKNKANYNTRGMNLIWISDNRNADDLGNLELYATVVTNTGLIGNEGLYPVYTNGVVGNSGTTPYVWTNSDIKPTVAPLSDSTHYTWDDQITLKMELESPTITTYISTNYNGDNDSATWWKILEKDFTNIPGMSHTGPVTNNKGYAAYGFRVRGREHNEWMRARFSDVSLEPMYTPAEIYYNNSGDVMSNHHSITNDTGPTYTFNVTNAVEAGLIFDNDNLITNVTVTADGEVDIPVQLKVEHEGYHDFIFYAENSQGQRVFNTYENVYIQNFPPAEIYPESGINNKLITGNQYEISFDVYVTNVTYLELRQNLSSLQTNLTITGNGLTNIVWKITVEDEGVHSLRFFASNDYLHTTTASYTNITVDNVKEPDLISSMFYNEIDEGQPNGSPVDIWVKVDHAIGGVLYMDGTNIADTNMINGTNIFTWDSEPKHEGYHDFEFVFTNILGESDVFAPQDVLVNNYVPNFAFSNVGDDYTFPSNDVSSSSYNQKIHVYTTNITYAALYIDGEFESEHSGLTYTNDIAELDWEVDRDAEGWHKLMVVVTNTEGDTASNEVLVEIDNLVGIPASVYISPDGDDSDIGGKFFPWKSLQKAVDSVVDSSFALTNFYIYLHGGTYDYLGDIGMTNVSLTNATEQNRLVICAVPGDEVIITPSSHDGYLFDFRESTVQMRNITFKDITLSNSLYYKVIDGYDNSSLSFKNITLDNFNIFNNTYEWNPTETIFFRNVDGLKIINSHFEGNNPDQSDHMLGLYMVSNVIISNCVFKDLEEAIYIEPQESVMSTNIVIQNNDFISNNPDRYVIRILQKINDGITIDGLRISSNRFIGGGETDMDAFVYIGEGTNVVVSHNLFLGGDNLSESQLLADAGLIVHNTFVNSSADAIRTESGYAPHGGANRYVSNNIIINAAGYALNITDSRATVTYAASNVFYNNASNVENHSRVIYSAASNITGIDPLLDADNYYKLSKNSPITNMAAFISGISIDNEGDGYEHGYAEYNYIAPLPFSLSQPGNNSLLSGTEVSFSWGETTDVYKGLEYYLIEVSTNEDFDNVPVTYSANTSTDSNVNITVSPGLYKWRVIAYDNFGNARVSSQTNGFTLDTTAPVIANEFSDVSPIQWRKGSISIDGTVTEDYMSLAGLRMYTNGAFFEELPFITNDGTNFVWSNSAFDTTLLNDGINTIVLYAMNDSVPALSNSRSFELRVDNTAPVISSFAIDAVTNGKLYGVNPSVVEETAGLAKVVIGVTNGTRFETNTYSDIGDVVVNELTTPATNLLIRYTDHADNISEPFYVAVVNEDDDDSAPIPASEMMPTSTEVVRGEYDFSGVISEPQSGLRPIVMHTNSALCDAAVSFINSGSNTFTWSKTFDTTGFANGTHELTLYITNNTPNPEGTNITYSFSVDNELPSFSSAPSMAGGVASNGIIYNFRHNASDNVSGLAKLSLMFTNGESITEITNISNVFSSLDISDKLTNALANIYLIAEDFAGGAATNEIVLTNEIVAPGVAYMTPTNGSIDLSVDTNFTLAFKEGVAENLGKEFTLTNITDGTSQSANIVHSGISRSGGTISINSAVFSLDYKKDYALMLEANAYKNGYGVGNEAIDETMWTFSTVDRAPEILSFTNTSLDVAERELMLEFDLRDLDGDLMDASLSYKLSADSAYTTISASKLSAGVVGLSDGTHSVVWSLPDDIDPQSLYDIKLSIDADGLTDESEISVSFSRLFSKKSTLSEVKIVGNPYVGETDGVQVVNMTETATINIYTISGNLVRRIEVESAAGSAVWDVRNQMSELVAPGIYLCEVVSGSERKVLKIIVGRHSK